MLAGKVRRSEIQFIAYKSADRLPRIDSGADALAVDREFDAAHADNASMMLRDTVAACVLASNGSGSTPASRRSSSKAARMSDRISARSEEHTSELQSLMRISYAVFCLKKKTYTGLNLHINNPQKT